jgi:hypothetical protein
MAFVRSACNPGSRQYNPPSTAPGYRPEGTVKDVDDTLAETIDDEELAEDEADDGDEEPTASDLADTDVPDSSDDGEDVESIQELLTKQEAGEESDDDDGDEPPPPAPAPRGETTETADNRVVPMQSSEFQCTNCFLVKHRSQLADPKKMRCRDCA